MTRRSFALLLLLPLLALAAACGDDEDPAVTADAPVDGGTGTVVVQLVPMQGRFVEGFEIGLRFETGDGEVIDSTLWSDAVLAAGEPTLDSYYTHVLEQEVPAGPIVVLATPTIGPGGPPPVPDLEGEMGCRLEVDVPDGGRVRVEVGFDPSSPDCLRLLD